MGKNIKVGFIGVSASGMPKRFAACMQEQFGNLQLVSAWDENREKLAEFCKNFRIKTLADDPESVAKEAEMVIMDVKSCDTARIAPPILKLGVPVYISKPLANNLENGLKVLATARSGNTPLLCASAMRYDSATQEAAQKIKNGDLGDLHLAFIALHHTVNAYLAPGEEWHVSAAGGGGPLFYLGVHAVDILDELMGLNAIEWLDNTSAILRHGAHPIFRQENMPDTNAVNIRYKSGLIATLHLASGVDYCFYGAELTGSKAHHIFQPKNDYPATIKKIVEMISSGKSPLTLENMERVARVLDLSFRSGQNRMKIPYSAALKERKSNACSIQN